MRFLMGWRSGAGIDSRAGAPEDEDLDEPEPDSGSDEDQMSC